MGSPALIIIAILLIALILALFKDKIFKKKEKENSTSAVIEKATNTAEKIVPEIKTKIENNIVKNIKPVKIPGRQPLKKNDGETIRMSVMSILQVSRYENKEPYVLPLYASDFVDSTGAVKSISISHPGAKADGIRLCAPKSALGTYDISDIDVHAAMTVNTKAISIHRRFDDNNNPRYFCRVDNKEAVVYRTVNFETPEQIFPGEFFEIHNGLKICVGEQWLIFIFAPVPAVPNKDGRVCEVNIPSEIPSLNDDNSKYKFRPDKYDDADDIPEIPNVDGMADEVKPFYPPKKKNTVSGTKDINGLTILTE